MNENDNIKPDVAKQGRDYLAMQDDPDVKSSHPLSAYGKGVIDNLVNEVERLRSELDYDPDDPNWGTKEKSKGQLRRIIRKQHKSAKTAHATIKLLESRWLAEEAKVANAIKIASRFNHADLMSDDDWAELRMALRPETREVE